MIIVIVLLKEFQYWNNQITPKKASSCKTIEIIETTCQAEKRDSFLESCIDQDPLGVEKSIFQQVAANSDFQLEKTILREHETSKDQPKSQSQNIPNSIEDCIFQQVANKSDFQLGEIILRELEACKDHSEFGL